MSRVSQSSNFNSSDRKLFGNNICLEYILAIDEFGFDSFLHDSRAKAIATKTNCYIELTTRILNKRINLYRWTKYAIVKVTGPDEVAVNQCLRLLERQFPIFLHRKEYSRRANVTIFTNDTAFPDNIPGGNAVVRSGSTMSCCRGLSVKSPYVNDDKRTVEKTTWKIGQSDFEGNYNMCLLRKIGSQPPITDFHSRFSSMDSASTKFSKNEMFGPLGTLSKNGGLSAEQPAKNLTVRISIDNLDKEAKSCQTSFQPLKCVDEKLLGNAASNNVKLNKNINCPDKNTLIPPASNKNYKCDDKSLLHNNALYNCTPCQQEDNLEELLGSRRSPGASGTLSKNVGCPSEQSAKNLTVRVSIDNLNKEAKISQTSFQPLQCVDEKLLRNTSLNNAKLNKNINCPDQNRLIPQASNKNYKCDDKSVSHSNVPFNFTSCQQEDNVEEEIGSQRSPGELKYAISMTVDGEEKHFEGSLETSKSSVFTNVPDNNLTGFPNMDSSPKMSEASYRTTSRGGERSVEIKISKFNRKSDQESNDWNNDDQFSEHSTKKIKCENVSLLTADLPNLNSSSNQQIGCIKVIPDPPSGSRRLEYGKESLLPAPCSVNPSSDQLSRSVCPRFEKHFGYFTNLDRPIAARRRIRSKPSTIMTQKYNKCITASKNAERTSGTDGYGKVYDKDGNLIENYNGIGKVYDKDGNLIENSQASRSKGFHSGRVFDEFGNEISSEFYGKDADSSQAKVLRTEITVTATRSLISDHDQKGSENMSQKSGLIHSGENYSVHKNEDGSIDIVCPPLLTVSISTQESPELRSALSKNTTTTFASENIIHKIPQSTIESIDSVSPDNRRLSVSIVSSNSDRSSLGINFRLTYTVVRNSREGNVTTCDVMINFDKDSEERASLSVVKEATKMSTLSTGSIPVRHTPEKVKVTSSQFQSSQETGPISKSKFSDINVARKSSANSDNESTTLSIVIRKVDERDPEPLSALLEINKSNISSEGIVHLEDDQRNAMEFKLVESNKDSSDKMNLVTVNMKVTSKDDTKSSNLNPIPTIGEDVDVQKVSGIKIDIVSSKSLPETPKGVYLKGVNEFVNQPKPVFSKPDGLVDDNGNDTAKYIASKLENLADGVIVLMFEGLNIYSTGSKSVAIRPTEADSENGNYDFESTNYNIKATCRTGSSLMKGSSNIKT